MSEVINRIELILKRHKEDGIYLPDLITQIEEALDDLKREGFVDKVINEFGIKVGDVWFVQNSNNTTSPATRIKITWVSGRLFNYRIENFVGEHKYNLIENFIWVQKGEESENGP